MRNGGGMWLRRESDQDVSVGAMLELMVDGAYAEFTFENAEDGFNLRQLYIAMERETLSWKS